MNTFNSARFYHGAEMPASLKRFSNAIVTALLLFMVAAAGFGQGTESEKPRKEKKQKGVRVVTIPVSTRAKGKDRPEEGSSIDFVLKENGEEQKILSIRG